MTQNFSSTVGFTAFGFAATSLLVLAIAQAEAEPTRAATPVRTPHPLVEAGTLSCHLEYLRATPYAALPITSFQQPMAAVSTQGASASDGTYQLFAWVNPAPSTNLAFELGVNRVSTGNTVMYTVSPMPAITDGFLFETGARIAPIAIGGTTYDHLRAYCSLTP